MKMILGEVMSLIQLVYKGLFPFKNMYTFAKQMHFKHASQVSITRQLRVIYDGSRKV